MGGWVGGWLGGFLVLVKVFRDFFRFFMFFVFVWGRGVIMVTLPKCFRTPGETPYPVR